MKGETLELLCFEVGGRTFALDIMAIREILRCQTVTAVPHAPREIVGVLNLRGSLIPVIHLGAALLDAEGGTPSPEAKLVVVRVLGRTAALLVDRVLEVVSVPLDELSPLPGGGREGNAAVAAFRKELEGVARVVMLVRLSMLLGPDVSIGDAA